MAFEYADGLDYIARERYKTKLAAAGLASCLYKLEAPRWINDPTQWPDVQFPDIFSYLIDTPGVYTKEAMRNYRSLEAHNYYISGWVNTVYHCMTESALYLMKADVKSSQRLNADPHHPWVVVKKEGVVIAAHCDCMAGLGESCSHVAALLFKIEGAVRMGYTTTAVTDNPCLWNHCANDKIVPVPIYNIAFYKGDSKDKLGKREQRGRPTIKATAQQQEEFLMKLFANSPNSVGLSSFNQFAKYFSRTRTVDSKSNQNEQLPINLRDLYNAENITQLDSALQTAKEKVSETTAEEWNYLLKASKAQVESTTWHEMRLGRVTASRMHSVLHTSTENPAPSVLKSICSPSPSLSHIPAIKWGREHETQAIEEYEKRHRESHKGLNYTLSVERTGLWLHKEFSFIGASPDALAHCSICGNNGVLEVKSPHKYEDYVSMEQILLDKNGCVNPDLGFKKSHAYYSQVQTQIIVCEAKFADFVLWTPNFSLINRIFPDADFADSVMDVVPKFWFEHYLPEPLTQTLDHGEVEKEPAGKSSQNTAFQYCYCRSAIGGLMVCCGNPGCGLKWFHLLCMNRKRAPKGAWYCKDCKSKK